MDRVKFGTDGWRSVIAEDFTFDNVRVVAQGVAGHVNSRQKPGRGIVVGHDNRFLSEDFARAVGEVLAANSIPVLFPRDTVPTPVLAFAIKDLHARGGVMITASHNPPEYNGIKFIPEYAGPALPEVTREIEAAANEVLDSGRPKRMPRREAEEAGMWREIDPRPNYFGHLKTLLDADVIRQNPLKVVIDPLFGAGIGYLETLLADMGCTVEAIHDYRDPLFGGEMPDPCEQNLSLLRERVLATGADLGLALDGDGDRFGIIDRTGKFFTPNEILFLLLDYLVNTRGAAGSVARTCATTHLLDRVADKNGLLLRETPVGFKYIGQCLLDDNCLLGGEESGGMSIHGHVPEKDGILGAALTVEMTASTGKVLSEIQRELHRKYGKLVSERTDIQVAPEAKNGIIAKLHKYEPDSLGHQEVIERADTDGTKLVNADGSWVLVRPSGTEPVFRVYVEAGTEGQLNAIRDQVRSDLGI